MKRYEVHFTDEAWEPIQVQARYIAVQNHAPANASRWLNRLLNAIDSLEQMPQRYAVDQEQASLHGTPVYRMVFERTCLVFCTIDQKHNRVDIVSFRHGAREGK